MTPRSEASTSPARLVPSRIFRKAPAVRRPRRLGDPLLLLGRLVGLSMLVEGGFALVRVFHGWPLFDELGWLRLASQFLFWRILPHRHPNAIYLRGFNHDARTLPVRQAIQDGLGRRFRLAGIRAPGRRWSALARWAMTSAFCFRYATPRYMNLEAGDDWFARLWRNLGDARCGFIDLFGATPFVFEEIRLVHRCLGPDRILFIGNNFFDEDGWRDRVASKLGLDPEARAALRVAIWESWEPAEIARFRREVAGFAAGLPARPAGFRPEAAPLVESVAGPPTPRWREWARIATFLAAGPILGYLALAAIPRLFDIVPRNLIPTVLAALVGSMAVVALAVMIALAVGFLAYFRDCGNKRERGLLMLTAAPVLALMVLAHLHVDRPEQDRLGCSGNLRSIGLALQEYERDNGRYPPAFVAGPDGRPWHSWRVLLLPYLGERPLFDSYRFDQPWDGPDNRRLAGRMPSAYRCPGGPGGPTTRYQAVVGPETAFPGAGSSRLSDLVDGPFDTIGIVEVQGEGVAWSEPRDIDVDGLLATIARDYGPWPHGHGFEALFLDGTARWLSSSTRPAILRALTTRGGHELIDPTDY